MLWDKIKKKELKHLAGRLKMPPKRVFKAMEAAEKGQKKFYADIRNRGLEILDNLKDDQLAVVIVGRPYNACDPGACQDLPYKHV